MVTCFRLPAGPCQSPYFPEKGFFWGWPQAGKLGLLMGGVVVFEKWGLKSLTWGHSLPSPLLPLLLTWHVGGANYRVPTVPED